MSVSVASESIRFLLSPVVAAGLDPAASIKRALPSSSGWPGQALRAAGP
jgi:hypothetical protein